MLPIIAIVGRPNVGKSTLFNRLTQSRQAIVGDMSGLTRDRQYGMGKFGEKNYIIIDTGGIGKPETGIEALMEKQAQLAINESEIILFMLDAKHGLHPEDITIANALRKLNKPIYLVANKVDHREAKHNIQDFYKLGLGDPYQISASHGDGVHKLLADVFAKIPKTESIASTVSTLDKSKKNPLHIAFLGRPNVGKSTLVNRILGEERVIVYDQPGTTRDSIFINFSRQNKDYVLIDTAGVRRRGRISDQIEKFSVIKALQAIAAANVVVLLIDAKENITDQDLKLLGFTIDAGKALVIAVNKWDGLPPSQREKIKSELDRRLVFAKFAEIYFISALHGTGVGNLFTAVEKAYTAATKQLKTPQVTRALQHAIEAQQPPIAHGRRIKLRYAHVGGHNPPLIIIHGTQVAEVPESYRRYLENYFRKAFKLWGTPIRIEFSQGKNPFNKKEK
ncbi:MAG: ribosome biogenesis GTPase Der [Gammaproteobacteria bacterium]|nr:ribosome biogenesis GTPase Der [Gammaproteobacteria bacterium]